MEMNELRRFLPQRIGLAKTNPYQVAVLAELGTSAVRDIIEGRSTKPRYATLAAIARVLGCSVEDLYRDPHGIEPSGIAAPANPQPVDIFPSIRMTAGARDLPVRGQARTGHRGFFLDNGEVIAWIERPPALAGVAKAFAVYVRGDSMEPRYFDGELVHINPAKPPRPGCFVLIELKNHEAFIKRLIKRNDSIVMVEQYNPVSTIEFIADQVLNVYRVVGSAEDG